MQYQRNELCLRASIRDARAQLKNLATTEDQVREEFS